MAMCSPGGDDEAASRLEHPGHLLHVLLLVGHVLAWVGLGLGVGVGFVAWFRVGACARLGRDRVRGKG